MESFLKSVITKRLLSFAIVVLPLIMHAQTYEQILTLDSCLSLARQNNKELRRAALDIDKAQQVKDQAFTKYFPQVKASAMGYHSLHPLVEVGINDFDNASVRDLLPYGAGTAVRKGRWTMSAIRYAERENMPLPNRKRENILDELCSKMGGTLAGKLLAFPLLRLMQCLRGDRKWRNYFK